MRPWRDALAAAWKGWRQARQPPTPVRPIWTAQAAYPVRITLHEPEPFPAQDLPVPPEWLIAGPHFLIGRVTYEEPEFWMRPPDPVAQDRAERLARALQQEAELHEYDGQDDDEERRVRPGARVGVILRSAEPVEAAHELARASLAEGGYLVATETEIAAAYLMAAFADLGTETLH